MSASNRFLMRGIACAVNNLCHACEKLEPEAVARDNITSSASNALVGQPGLVNKLKLATPACSAGNAELM
jgi:hypothetical protein